MKATQTLGLKTGIHILNRVTTHCAFASSIALAACNAVVVLVDWTIDVVPGLATPHIETHKSELGRAPSSHAKQSGLNHPNTRVLSSTSNTNQPKQSHILPRPPLRLTTALFGPENSIRAYAPVSGPIVTAKPNLLLRPNTFHLVQPDPHLRPPHLASNSDRLSQTCNWSYPLPVDIPFLPSIALDATPYPFVSFSSPGNAVLADNERAGPRTCVCPSRIEG